MPVPSIERRNLLRASGVSLALPFLGSRGTAALAAGPKTASGDDVPRRMVAINASMGLLPQHFFPDSAGKDFALPPYLEILQDHRQNFSVFSGLSHPEVDGGHHAESCYLTAAPHPGASGFRNTISVDQYAAERIGVRTRCPSLALHAGPGGHKDGLSWTASGVSIPAETKPSEIYKKLFLAGSEQDVEAKVANLRDGGSILDAVADRARSLQRRLGRPDQRKLDEYFSSVRELEKRLVAAQEWEKKPKPAVDAPIPQDIKDNAEILGQARLMYEMARLALQTDSTRVITLKVHSYARVNIEGVDEGHHSLTHHGNRPESLAMLRRIEEARLREFSEFLASLGKTEEEGESLLDRTMVLYGSHMGDANRHTNDNLPIMLAGGGFRHGQHLAFDAEHNTPLCNVFVSMLQRLGLETDRFASSTGTLTGLEMA